MGGKIMQCVGSINDQGDISVLGSYEVPGHPNWGWRIEIPCPTENEIRIIMFNISPTGEETLAGESKYNRV